jgi:glycerophosphoryl diester phosphodiesterase
MFTDLPHPTIFAHRGSSAHAPENTLGAIELAISHRADAIEIDVKLSADKKVVVIHDQTVDRTTDGSGNVGDMTVYALKELDAGSYFDITFKGEQIPTLSEVLELTNRRIFINIELTNYSSPRDKLPEIIVQDLKREKRLDHILFSSFNPFALIRIKQLLPEAPIGLLTLPGLKGYWARSGIGKLLRYQALHPELSDVTDQLINRIHHSGQMIHVYTVNKIEDLSRMFSMGVDGVFTDDPQLARKTLTQED